MLKYILSFLLWTWGKHVNKIIWMEKSYQAKNDFTENFTSETMKNSEISEILAPRVKLP